MTPATPGKYEKQQGFKVHISGAEMAHTHGLTHELKYFSGEHMAAVRGSGIHKQHRQVRIKSWWGEV